MKSFLIIRYLMIGFFILGLQGCCYFPCSQVKNCNPNDLYELGMCDGLRGIQRSLTQEINECIRLGATCNLNEYTDGWKQGIRDFCTPSNGYALGLQGKPYPCFCPPDLAGPFRAAWYQGVKCFYTPELGCGEGCRKTYATPIIRCGEVRDIQCFANGCPCR